MLNKILKALIYSTVFLMPVFFLPITFNVLDFNKLYLLFFLVWFSVLFWFLKMIVKDKEFKIRHSIIDYIILAFAGVAILSSIFSVDKFSSLFGHYGRFSTGLVGLLTLQAFYFLVVNNLGTRKGNGIKPAQNSSKTNNKVSDKGGVITVTGIINSLIGSGVVVMFFAYFALFGVWRKLAQINEHWFAFINNLALRVSPIGGSIEAMALFLVIVLLLAVFLILGGLSWTGFGDALNRKKQKKGKRKAKNIFIAIYIFLASILLIIADFNLAWLCLIIGLLALSIAVLRTRVLKKEVHRLILPIALIIIAGLFLILNFRAISATFPNFVLNSSPGFLAEQGLSQNESWLIAGKTATHNFKSGLIGSGPGTFGYDFSQFRPKSMNQGILWSIRFDRPNSGVAEILATMGVLGLLSFLVVSFWAFQVAGVYKNFSLRPRKTKRKKIDLATYFFSVFFLTMLLIQFFYYQTLTLNFLFWLFLGLLIGWQYIKPQREEEAKLFKETSFKLRDFVELALVLETICIVLFLAFIILSFYGLKFYLADAKYASALQNPDLSKKIETLQQGIKLNPYQARYQIVLSKVFLTKAQAEVSNSSNKAKQDQNEQNTIVQELKMAQAFASNATLVAPKDISAWQNLADTNQAIMPLSKDNESFAKSAIKALQKISELEPVNPKTYSDIGELDLVLKKDDEARAEFEKSLAQKSNFAPASINMALMLEKEKKPGQAITVLENVLKTNPNQAEVLFHLGRINYNQGNIEKSIVSFQKALAINPKYSNARYSLAIAYEKQGKTDKAIQELEVVAKANPGIKEIQDRINRLKNSQSQPKETIKEPIQDLQTGDKSSPSGSIDNLGK